MTTEIKESEVTETITIPKEKLVGMMAVAKTLSLAAKRGKTAYGNVLNLFQDYEPLAYYLPWEVMDYLELLSTYNPDFSQAVDNIRTLANSGHNLYVDANSELQTRRIKDLLEEKARSMQDQHGGIDGIIDKLLDQAATYGAMCGEWLIDDDITDVVDFRDMNPKSIRFFLEDGDFVPYQKVKPEVATELEKQGRKVRRRQYVKLNTETFKYYSFDAAPASPYGTPPFLAALPNIAIQQDMLDNLSQVVKKIGLLGMIDATIEKLQLKAGETDAEYQARANKYLSDYVTVIEEMVKDGGLVHFDDMEISTSQLTGNASGVTNIFKQNEELIFSGLKSMPSVQGRSYSTTETYAGVAYDIIVRNTSRYQRGAKRMIEAGYWLICTVNALTPKKINVRFNYNKTLQRLQDSQAHRLEIQNVIVKWANGFIDQRDASQELGYAEAKEEYEEPQYIPKDWEAGADINAGEDEPPTGSEEPPDDEAKRERLRELGVSEELIDEYFEE